MALIDEALKRSPRNNSFGDAAAAMSNPNVTQVQATPAPAPAPMPVPALEQSAAAQMTALPGAAPASLDNRVSQIPTGGLKAPAPDGRGDTELGRNVNNTVMALPGVGGITPRAVGGATQAAGRALSTERVLPAAWEVVQEGGALAKSGSGAATQLSQIASGRGDAIARASGFSPQMQSAGQLGRTAPALNAPSQGGQIAQRAPTQVGEATAAGFAPRSASAAQWADVVPPAALTAAQAVQPAASTVTPALSLGAGRHAAGAGAATLISGSTNPNAAQPAVPEQAPAATSKPNFFPGNSPDAGKNIYAGVGLGKGGEQQAAGAPNDSRRIDSLVSQIPRNGGAPAPAADGSQEQWRNTELGRNANNAMMALPGVGGLGRIAATGGAISTGLNAASSGVNAASRMAAFGAGVTASGTATPAAASAPAPNPYANVTPEQGRAMAEINAKAQSPMAVIPTAQRPIEGGIERIDRPGHSPLFTDNKDPDMARFLARPAGGPTKEVNDIMQRMSDQSDAERANRFQAQDNAAQYAREVQQAQAVNASAGAHARTVQNRMDQEKYLRQLEVNASSRTGSSKERLANQQAYHDALSQDAGFRAGADAGSVARTQNEGSSARERMQQAGSTAREQMQEVGRNSRFGQEQGLAQQKFGMEREAQGFSNRAAAQSEQLRNVLLDPKATPEQRKVAQRSLAALSGKTAADRMQTVNLPDTTTDMGAVVRGGQALVRTLEDGTVEEVPIGAQGQGGAQPSANHLAALRANPKQADFFDQVYGKGAAARILGGR